MCYLCLRTPVTLLSGLYSNGAPTFDQRGYIRSFTAEIGACEADGIMPVELHSFAGHFRNGSVQLKWSTATEINNLGFEIERNAHGTWEFAGFVDGHGNSNSPRQYFFSDVPPEKAHVVSYRLKQIDRDGRFEYSSMITINLKASPTTATLHSNYPNPCLSSTDISYTLPDATPVTLTIYNATGVQVKELINGMQEAGTYLVHYNAKNQPAGLYFISMETTYGKQIRKMILTK